MSRRFPRVHRWLPAALIAAISFCLLATACSSKSKQPSPSPAASAAATQAAPPVTAPAGGVPAQTPSAPTPSESAGGQPSTPTPASAPATPRPAPVFTGTPPPPPPPPLAAPCRDGQIKGNQNTHDFLLPGMLGYNDLRSNVQCFNSMDDAKGAGYHLPGQGG